MTLSATLLFLLPQLWTHPQATIDQAEPNSIVEIDQRAAAAWNFPRLVIDKSLTVIGRRSGGVRPQFYSLILKGAEHVKLVSLETRAPLDVPRPFGAGMLSADSTLEIEMFDCELGGRIEARGARSLLLERTIVTSQEDAPGRLVAPGARVLIFDSRVLPAQGGFAPDVLASSCFQSGSRVGGVGAIYDCPELVRLDNDLTLTGNATLGGRLHLEWTTAGGLFLYSGLGVHAPTLTSSGAWDFLGPQPMFVRAASAGRCNIPIPSRIELAGQSLTFQVLGFFGELSRPQFAVLRP
jgi:hypothetical protein